jgi:hypothetical protein
VLTLTQSFDYQGKVDESHKHDVELVEAGEDAEKMEILPPIVKPAAARGLF